MSWLNDLLTMRHLSDKRGRPSLWRSTILLRPSTQEQRPKWPAARPPPKSWTASAHPRSDADRRCAPLGIHSGPCVASLQAIPIARPRRGRRSGSGSRSHRPSDTARAKFLQNTVNIIPATYAEHTNTRAHKRSLSAYLPPA